MKKWWIKKLKIVIIKKTIKKKSVSFLNFVSSLVIDRSNSKALLTSLILFMYRLILNMILLIIMIRFIISSFECLSRYSW